MGTCTSMDHVWNIPPDGGPIQTGTLCNCPDRREWGADHRPVPATIELKRGYFTHMTRLRKREDGLWERHCTSCDWCSEPAGHPEAVLVLDCPAWKNPNDDDGGTE